MRIGIISSFNTLCGNATYSEAIYSGLKSKNFNKHDLERIDIDISLQKKFSISKKEKILNKVKACDVCNLQLEINLFGPSPSKATDTICEIIDNIKKGSITMHRIEDISDTFLKDVYGYYKRSNKSFFTSFLSAILESYKDRYQYSQYKKIIKIAHKNKLQFIVHTSREKERILAIANDAVVHVHPIMWPAYPDTEHVDLEKYFTESKKLIVGLFGFVTEYKNYELVLELLKINPEAFNLLICGGVHPQSKMYGKKDMYVNKIEKMITKDISKSVFWKTGLTDKDFIAHMKSVDICIVPYFETGQSGSGIVSLAIQNAKKTIISDTTIASMIQEFLDQKLIVFDVNSTKNLYDAIHECNLDDSYRPKFHSSFEKMIDFYFSSLSN